MSKILGLDLGTNSIGWAIRDTSEPGNQIIDKGVLTFEKGVGEEKGVEFPLVKKRTESRSKRRHYQAEKYRKWTLLQTLIENGMCPLTIEELDQWRKYTKGHGRKYPQSPAFINWLRFDFDGDGKPDFERLGFSKHENHYLFRMLAVSADPDHKDIFKNNQHLLGRVFYHLVQRRGFRGRDDEEARTILQGSKDGKVAGAEVISPLISQYKTLGAALYHLHKDKSERIRKRYNLRTDYAHELQQICQAQNVAEPVYKRLEKSIVWQRPLRSQKGLVGICTFEQNKPRCPVSHPFYEEYRVWININNLKIQLPDGIDKHTYIQEKIYPLFYRKDRDFKLTVILKELRKVGGSLGSRFKDDTKIPSATLLNTFKEFLGDNWKDQYGWDLALENQSKTAPYSFEDIWHVLFTFDDREKLAQFAKEKLGLDEEKAEKFAKIKLQQGYATLSISAIRKILPFLKGGYLYSHAIYLANLHKVLGKNTLSFSDSQMFSTALKDIIDQHRSEQSWVAVINGLISDQLNGDTRFGMDPAYQLDKDDMNDIQKKLEEELGEYSWKRKSEEEKNTAINFIAEKYLSFLRRPVQYSKEPVYTRLPRLHDRILSYLRETYDIPVKNEKYLWHPSEQESYPAAKYENGIPVLGDPMPISRGFKNPMALKTLHQLKKLLNHLLKAGKIDEDTRVVVEIARELNDANKRKAIERWQRDREKENDEYRKRIEEDPELKGLLLDVKNKDVIDKYRLWIEQNKTCLYTGNIINLYDLFTGKFDFEHTIPASISFDNELKNLTIADGTYNKQIKKKLFPTQLPNYDKEATVDGIVYSAIKPRLEFIVKKVEELEALQEEWTNKTRFASTKEIKDACIQRRHIISFDLGYWRQKLNSFTLTEYKAGWKNSQLRDTQIITKYALPYLKTVFRKVEVEKGSVVSDFRKIYSIQPKAEKKARTRHSHHAIDAAVLTLIPPAAIRDRILAKFNELKDQNINLIYHEPVTNWKDFTAAHILSIEEGVLNNFQPQQRTLTQTYKNVRKRGAKQFVKEKLADGKWQYKLDGKGQRIPLVAKGDNIRGQLHKESFFGAIKLDGEKWLVERYPVSSFTTIKDCRHIVDPKVREIVQEALEKRMSEGMPFDKAKLDPIPFPGGKEVIWKVRCKVAAGVGYLTPKKALEINRHDFLSKHDYKHSVYAQNEENTLCLFYEGVVNGKDERAFKVVGLFELAQLKLKKIDHIKSEKYYQTVEAGRGKNKAEIPLSYIITVGIKVIPFKNSKDELKDLSEKELLRRIYRVYKFNEPAPSTVYIYMQNHLEARPNDELGNGEKDLNLERYQPRVFLNAAKFTCAIEGRDFSIDLDGTIRWLF
ncbi:MAG: hypothetical protein DI535_20145 [Citrobacter freundii]|nr:MAG: hypothetical protein DI535_20145 [Citrobacter freundii]